jgi:hypothetical protein
MGIGSIGWCHILLRLGELLDCQKVGGFVSRESKARAKACAEAGILPIRIGPKERAKDRKARENKQKIFLPVPKNSEPLTALEQHEIFDRARKAKNDMRDGKRPVEPVELDGEALDVAGPTLISIFEEAIQHLPMPRLRVGRHPPRRDGNP